MFWFGHFSFFTLCFVLFRHHASDIEKFCRYYCNIFDLSCFVFRRFNNENCRALVGKPKFFIIQACRGTDYDYGTKKLLSADVTDSRSFNSQLSSSLPPGSPRFPSTKVGLHDIDGVTYFKTQSISKIILFFMIIFFLNSHTVM